MTHPHENMAENRLICCWLLRWVRVQTMQCPGPDAKSLEGCKQAERWYITSQFIVQLHTATHYDALKDFWQV